MMKIDDKGIGMYIPIRVMSEIILKSAIFYKNEHNVLKFVGV